METDEDREKVWAKIFEMGKDHPEWLEPSREELIARLKKLAEQNPDLPKLYRWMRG